MIMIFCYISVFDLTVFLQIFYLRKLVRFWLKLKAEKHLVNEKNMKLYPLSL